MTDPLLRTLTDHAAITDAVHRYTAGLDLGDTDLLASSLTEDAVVDLSPATAKIGFAFPALQPRQVVVDSLIPAVGPVDTSHAVSNVRITIEGDTATVKCYAMAQHFAPGDGPKPDRTRHALMMNRYDAEAVRDGETWRMSKLVIDNAWFEGDPDILTGG